MNISIRVPNPLARLTRILDLLEQGRAGIDPRIVDPDNAMVRRVEPPNECRADAHDDLESLSLSRCGSTPGGRYDDLDFFSLSRVDGTTPGRRDSLGDLSLTRSFPPRPGT